MRGISASVMAIGAWPNVETQPEGDPTDGENA